MFCFAGYKVTEEQLREVAIHAEVLSVGDDFLTPSFREECERIIDYKLIKPNDCKHAFNYLKEHFQSANVTEHVQ